MYSGPGHYYSGHIRYCSTELLYIWYSMVMMGTLWILNFETSIFYLAGSNQHNVIMCHSFSPCAKLMHYSTAPRYHHSYNVTTARRLMACILTNCRCIVSNWPNTIRTADPQIIMYMNVPSVRCPIHSATAPPTKIHNNKYKLPLSKQWQLLLLRRPYCRLPPLYIVCLAYRYLLQLKWQSKMLRFSGCVRGVILKLGYFCISLVLVVALQSPKADYMWESRSRSLDGDHWLVTGYPVNSAKLGLVIWRDFPPPWCWT